MNEPTLQIWSLLLLKTVHQSIVVIRPKQATHFTVTSGDGLFGEVLAAAAAVTGSALFGEVVATRGSSLLGEVPVAATGGGVTGSTKNSLCAS